MPNLLYIPDTQIRHGEDTEYIGWISKYIRHKKPDIIVQGGDWNDYYSLNSYERGKKPMEGARVKDDISAGRDALQYLESFFPRRYNPRKVHLLGNHEQRVYRYENDYPQLEGMLGHPSQYFIDAGWEVYPFLQAVEIEGVYFAHYFTRGPNGNATKTGAKNGQPSALTQAKREMVSCVAGHKQGFDSAILETRRGRIRSIIAGSCYTHDEPYMDTNDYWRGCLMLNDMRDGDFELSEVSLRYLERKYG